MTNVVKDGLVDRQTGNVFLSAYPSLAKGKKMKFWKIDWHLFHKKGGYRVKSHRPKDYIIWREIEFSWLASYLNWPLEKRQTRLRKEVAKKTNAIAEQMQAEGKTPMSIIRLKKIKPRSKPSEPRNSTRQPQCHASTVEAADEFQERKRQFINKYIPASANFRNGNHQCVFPKGAYRPPLMNICTGD